MKQSIQKQISKLHRKFDKQIQEYYIKKYPVSILGGRTEVMHHFIYKSQSTFLRHHEKNLIPLTNAQHFNLHTKDSSMAVLIADIKGEEWFKWIGENRRNLVKRDKIYLEELSLKANREL